MTFWNILIFSTGLRFPSSTYKNLSSSLELPFGSEKRPYTTDCTVVLFETVEYHYLCSIRLLKQMGFPGSTWRRQQNRNLMSRLDKTLNDFVFVNKYSTGHGIFYGPSSCKALKKFDKVVVFISLGTTF